MFCAPETANVFRHEPEGNGVSTKHTVSQGTRSDPIEQVYITLWRTLNIIYEHNSKEWMFII